MASSELISEVHRTIEVYEEAIGNFAGRTRQMLNDNGYIPALSRLVQSPDLQTGFRVLRDRGDLRNTFEAVIVQFSTEFSAEVVEAAQWRLDNADELLRI
ncbi:hypothetical protein [Microbulbifer pacificus]|uniref:hypothetical protein n=1 Tax=Microbulbifer pacificus TaxID=407164 RepID=UPI000CF534F6|nr:hypothetical protein [Microbulbifer pacificus]